MDATNKKRWSSSQAKARPAYTAWPSPTHLFVVMRLSRPRPRQLCARRHLGIVATSHYETKPRSAEPDVTRSPVHNWRASLRLAFLRRRKCMRLRANARVASNLLCPERLPGGCASQSIACVYRLNNELLAEVVASRTSGAVWLCSLVVVCCGVTRRLLVSGSRWHSSGRPSCACLVC